MKRVVYAVLVLMFLFQMPCYLVFAEKKENVKITGVEVNVEGSDSYGYKLNCTANNNEKDSGEIKVYSPHSSEWKIDWSQYHDIKDKMPHYNLETINYGKTQQGRSTVKTTNMTVYPCEVLSKYDSGLWQELLSNASEEKPDIFQVTKINGREALIVGEYDYDKELFTYSQNNSGIIKVNSELGVSVYFEVYFHINEFDSMGNVIMMTKGSGYSSYSIPDVVMKDQVKDVDVVPVEEIVSELKVNVDSYLDKALQIPKNTKIKVDKVPFEKNYKPTENKDSKLVIMEILTPGNVIKVVVGIAIPGIGIVLIKVLGTRTPSIPTPSAKIGPTGIKDGTERILKGKTDGREYNIKYDAEKDEWTNTETGNIFIPERFEGWQQDLAKDWEQSSKEREKMSNRDTEFDREVKKSVEKDREDAELLKKLHYMRKILNLQRTDAGRINRPPGEPGSMTDKINKLEDQLINGKSVDKELLKKVQRVYTKASNGEISGYHDLPNINVGQEFVDGMKLTGKEIFSGSSKKALVLRGLLGIATGGTAAVAIEMGREVASAGFVIKDYVDKGGDSVVNGIILAAGNTLISEGAGQVTGRYLKYLSNQSSRAFHNFAANTKEGYKFFKKFDHLKSGKVSIKGKDISIGLKDEMIDRVIENTSEIGKNIFVAPPFQDVYKSFFIK